MRVKSQTVRQEEFAGKLAQARRALHRSSIRAQIPKGCTRSLYGTAAVAVGYSLMRVGCLLMSVEPPVGWKGLTACMALAVILPMAITLILAYKRTPSLSEAAERLDFSANDHNRIATSLSLMMSNTHTSFAKAAIRDGEAYLEQLKDRLPQLYACVWDLRRAMWPAVATLIALTIAIMCDPRAISKPDVGGGPVGTILALADGSKVQTDEPDIEEGAKKAQRSGTTALASTGTSKAGMQERLPQKQVRAEVTGTANKGSTGKANTAEQAAGNQGESGNSTASSASKKNDSDRRKPGKTRPRRSMMMDPRNPQAEEEGASTSSGSAGGGSMSPVQNDWAQRAHTMGGEQDDSDSEEEVEDENESSSQRGGVQPSLKDRNEAPSREMGLSGEEGPPGTGRGGPTPPKKSRGTASLVLGVPIPDFIKGRMGPGTTKITHERTQPPAVPGESAAEGSVAARVKAEHVLRRLEIPSSLRTFVRDYLVALHSQDRVRPIKVGSKQSLNEKATEGVTNSHE